MKTTAFGKDYLPIIAFPLAGKFKKKDFAWIDLSSNNQALTNKKSLDIEMLQQIVDAQIAAKSAKIGIGGHGEQRAVYAQFKHFGKQKKAREIHLGIDIWAPKRTAVIAPLPGKIHSAADNDNLGDYGPTIIIEHMIGNSSFYTLYGHLSKKSLDKIEIGRIVKRGERIGAIGQSKHNGGWPPHLHFQIIASLKDYSGDYPGVCTKEEANKYLKNCPDPTVLFAHSWNDFLPDNHLV